MTHPSDNTPPAGEPVAVIEPTAVPAEKSKAVARSLANDPRPEAISAFHSLDHFRAAQSMALALCSSTIVPEAYRGEKNIGNVLIALEFSNRLGVSPVAVMQNLHVIKGKPSWGSPFLIGLINSCGRFSPLRFEWKGEERKNSWGCRAVASELATGQRLEGQWVTWEMANGEGWVTRADSKWRTMPAQMMVYRAASFWSRIFSPDLSLGMHTAEEVEDIPGGNEPTKSAGAVKLEEALRTAPAITVTEAPAAAEPAAPSIHAGPGPCEACEVPPGSPHKDACPHA